jgi:hypothetical protein
MNIGDATKLLIELTKQDLKTQYLLTILEPQQTISDTDKQRLEQILSHKNTRGISVYATPKNMGFMNGSLYRKNNQTQAIKKHKITAAEEAITFLEEHTNNYRVYHGTFDDSQIETSFLAQIDENNAHIWMKEGNVWDYTHFDAPRIDLEILPVINQEQLQLSFQLLRANTPNKIPLFVEGKITNSKHPHENNVMITDICEGYSNPYLTIPNHANIEKLYHQNSNLK